MSTQQQWLITVVIDGKSIGIFDAWNGGDVLAAESKHRPGGMGPETSYPSLPSPAVGTCSRVYERERDHEQNRTLTAKAGRATASVSEQPLDADGNKWGDPTIYKGRFLGIKRGTVDSDTGTPRMFELDISITSVA